MITDPNKATLSLGNTFGPEAINLRGADLILPPAREHRIKFNNALLRLSSDKIKIPGAELIRSDKEIFLFHIPSSETHLNKLGRHHDTDSPSATSSYAEKSAALADSEQIQTTVLARESSISLHSPADTVFRLTLRNLAVDITDNYIAVLGGKLESYDRFMFVLGESKHTSPALSSSPIKVSGLAITDLPANHILQEQVLAERPDSGPTAHSTNHTAPSNIL